MERLTKTMSDETANFLREARDFLEAQAVNRANGLRIENLFYAVIEKGREYRERNKNLVEENQTVKGEMSKVHRVVTAERNKNRKMQVEMKALKRKHDEMQQKLARSERRYQRLHQKMSKVIDEINEDGDDSDEILSTQGG